MNNHDATLELIAAIVTGNLTSVIKAVEHGGEINSGNGKPLFLAVSLNNTEMVKYLVKEGADVNITQVNVTALSCSILNENLEVVETLLNAGASINTNRNSAILQAAQKGNTKILNKLLEYGADIEKSIEIAKNLKNSEVLFFLENYQEKLQLKNRLNVELEPDLTNNKSNKHKL